jgi:mannan endo-1,4-beta-mannosidase
MPNASTPDPSKVYFQLLNTTGSYLNFGPDGLERLHYVVSAAEKFGVKLVSPFINNCGGMTAYGKAFGNNATTFYPSTAAQTAYKTYVKTVVTRYATSSATFACELGNEPRCRDCATSVVTNWATENLAIFKEHRPQAYGYPWGRRLACTK